MRKADAYSNQGSLVSMERFAKRHRRQLNELPHTDFVKRPSDSTLRLTLAKMDVPGIEALLRGWIAEQPNVVEGLETLVYNLKALRDSITERASGAPTLIAQASLYSQTLGVANAHTTYATDANGEILALAHLLKAVEHGGVLVKAAGALHANRPNSTASLSSAQRSSSRQTSE